MAVTGSDGTFEIKQLPSGMARFRVWHERTGWLDAGILEDGYFQVRLTGESVRLPTVRVSENEFALTKSQRTEAQPTARTLAGSIEPSDIDPSELKAKPSRPVAASTGPSLLTDSLVQYYDFTSFDTDSPADSEDESTQEYLRELDALRQKYENVETEAQPTGTTTAGSFDLSDIDRSEFEAALAGADACADRRARS